MKRADDDLEAFGLAASESALWDDQSEALITGGAAAAARLDNLAFTDALLMPEPYQSRALAAIIARHPPLDMCPDHECLVCGYRECPKKEPMHFHHDGCPACDSDEIGAPREDKP